MSQSKRNTLQLGMGALLLALACTVATPLWAAETASKVPQAKGLGDPGTLKTVRIEPSAEGKGIIIRGRDARQQLFVTGEYSSGQLRDLTQHVKFQVSPAGVLNVDDTGLVTPVTDGEATITAKTDKGTAGQIAVRVEGVAQQIPINFKNQIVPIFTKLGCNSGGCHGKASGQNGFKLSLLGFYPEDDYEFLVKEARGRRIFPSSPAESLILTKPTGRSPHGGGKRMDVDSHEYRILYRWIEQGMPYGRETDPVVTGIQCLPKGRVMDRGADQQITVQATYSDGTTEDVTRMALFEANDTEMAEATETGLVKTLGSRRRSRDYGPLSRPGFHLPSDDSLGGGSRQLARTAKFH